MNIEKMKPKLLILSCLLLAVFVPSAYFFWNSSLRGDGSKRLVDPTPEELAGLLASSDNTTRTNSAQKLLEIASQNGSLKIEISSLLIDETKRLCSGDEVLSDTQFIKLREISNLLVEIGDENAIDVMTDCSTRSTVLTGLSASNFATVPALIRYREKALPFLTKKLESADPRIRGQIVDILAELPREKVETILVEGQKREKDSFVMVHFQNALSAVRHQQ